MNTARLKKLYISVCALLCAVIAAVSCLFAWFSYGDKATGVDFKFIRINSTVTLYKGIDTNFNGIPDLLAGTETLEDLTKFDDAFPSADDEGADVFSKSFYYDEIYKFQKLKNAPAVSEELSKEVEFSISLENVLPTQIFTYKLVLNNKSDLANDVVFSFGKITDEVIGEMTDAQKLLATLSVKAGIVTSEDEKNVQITFLDKRYFANYLAESGEEGFTSWVITDSDSAIKIESGDHRDFWLCFEMETYDTLSALSSFSSLGISRDDYNALQSSSVDLPLLGIYLEINSDDYGVNSENGENSGNDGENS